jgi:CheY-like chemotaxis protein
MMASPLDSLKQVYLAGDSDDPNLNGADIKEADPDLLQGQKILLVEDEALVGMDLQMQLEMAGAETIGPIPSLEEAVSAATEGMFAAAILDIDLRGKDVFPAADQLKRRGIPFVFHTGHGRRTELTDDYPSVPVCKKPVNGDKLLRVLAGLLA